MFWARLFLALLFLHGTANAQTPGTFLANQVLTAAQLNAALQGKADFPFLGPGVLYANAFPGADLGQQIGACVAALPTFGGVCDARGLPNTGTIGTFTIAKSGVTILFPCGFYLHTGSIIVQGTNGVNGLIVTGCGASQNAAGTTLFWQGNATSPALDLRGVRDSEFSNFTISANSTLPLAEGIRRETWTGSVSTRVTFRNLIIAGNVANSLFKGIRWCTGFDCSNGVVIGNNDLDTVQNVLVANYTNCAFSIEGTQSKTHMFLNVGMAGQNFSMRGVCTTQGAGTGLGGNVTFLTNGTSACASGTYTVVGGTGTPATLNGLAVAGVITSLTVATAGTYSVMPPINPTISGTGCSVAPTIAYSTNASTNAGSFRWYGGAGGGSHQVADFDLGSVTDSLIINGCNFESSRRLLQTGGASSATWAINIQGCRWTSNAINPDGKAIIYQDRGPLNVSGLETETAGSTVPVVLSIESSGTPEVGNAIGNTIQTAAAVAGYTPFVCVPTTVSCWSTIGNLTSDNGSNDFQVPNVFQNGSGTSPVTTNCGGGNAYTVLATDVNLIFNDAAATCTVTLLAAASFPGRVLTVKTTQAQTVVSNASNVVPLAGGAAGTAVLAATAGRWAQLKSDGTNWVILEGN